METQNENLQFDTKAWRVNLPTEVMLGDHILYSHDFSAKQKFDADHYWSVKDY